MTSTSTSTPDPATSPFRKIVTITLAIVAAIVVAFFVFANLFTDFLWFDQLGYSEVLLVQWVGRAAMFVVGFIGMAVPIWLSIFLAYRLRPVYARLSSQLDRYQEVVEPLRRLAMWGIPVFFGFFAGFAASSNWQAVLLWWNGTPTGVTDPQFGMDTSFYLFDLPFYSNVVSFLSAVVIVSLLVTALVAYLYGSVRVGQGELRISKAARIQLAILAGIYLLVQSGSLFLDRFLTMSQQGERIAGPAYTGANAVIPGMTILSIAAAIVAVAFFVTAVIGKWRYPLIGTALLLVTTLVVSVGYPWAVTTFQVRPNEQAYEEPFFERNLEATREAYGLDNIETVPFSAVTDVEPGQLRNDAATTASIRLMDPTVIPPTVQQLQQFRNYYGFSDQFNVDRYEIDGEVQDTVVSVRELRLDQLGADAQSWNNMALVYTHGYGLVAAKGNERTSEGEPVFIESDIPSSGVFTDMDYQPRVYFGETSPEYSIVGAPEGTPDREIDYPSGVDGESQTSYTFTGDGGPSIGSFFSRVLYALKFQSEQILFSDAINEESQVLYDRDPQDRVRKVAPYLTLDTEAYPSVVDGRIVWIIDGYTTSSTYPYSTQVSLTQAISDASTPQPNNLLVDDINYLRNSVKATVDAYDGSVTLYAWDEEDPVLQAWQSVYPSTLRPVGEMSGDLMSHVRYPTDLFKVQRMLLGTYHVDTARELYLRSNAWTTPNDPQNNNALQPPYYLSMRMPDEEAPSFSIYSTFIPDGGARNVLMGYLSANADAGAEAGVVSDDYGQLTMLEIDADTTVPGPGQVQNSFDSDTAIAQEINLLRQGGSDVQQGNLLTLPVGGGLLYVQPMYVQSTSGTSFPLLRKVLVAFGDELAFEDTLAQALDVLFGGESGADTGDADVTPIDPETGEPTPDADVEPDTDADPDGDGGTVVPSADFDEALQAAGDAFEAKREALQSGDLAAFAEADAALTRAVERLLELEQAQTTD